MKFSYKPQIKEYLFSSLIIFAQNKLIILTAFVLALQMFFSVLSQLQKKFPSPAELGWILSMNIVGSTLFFFALYGFMLIIGLIAFYIRSMNLKSFFTEYVELNFDDHGFSSKRTSTLKQYRWECVKKMNETSQFFFVHLNDPHTPFFIIPKRIFNTPQEIIEFKSLMQSKQPPSIKK